MYMFQRVHHARCHRPKAGVGTEQFTEQFRGTYIRACMHVYLIGIRVCSKLLYPPPSTYFCFTVLARWGAELSRTTAGRVAGTASVPRCRQRLGTALTWSHWLSCFKSRLRYRSVKKDKDATLDMVYCEEIMFNRPNFNPHVEFST